MQPSGESSIKRKTGQDEQSSEQSSEQPDDDRRGEAAGSKKQHLMASVVSMPTTDSQSNLLDLQNDKLISDAANKKNESVIESTINNLPNVEPLSSLLRKAIHEPSEPSEKVNYAGCLSELQSMESQVLNVSISV